jgi:hypothetical protein
VSIAGINHRPALNAFLYRHRPDSIRKITSLSSPRFRARRRTAGRTPSIGKAAETRGISTSEGDWKMRLHLSMVESLGRIELGVKLSSTDSPQMPGPVVRMAPSPSRLITILSAMRKVPASLALVIECCRCPADLCVAGRRRLGQRSSVGPHARIDLRKVIKALRRAAPEHRSVKRRERNFEPIHLDPQIRRARIRSHRRPKSQPGLLVALRR